MTRHTRFLILLLLAALAPAPTPAAAQPAGAVQLLPRSPVCIADSNMVWSVYISVRNGGAERVILDSLAFECVSLDSGETGLPRLRRFSAPLRGFMGRMVAADSEVQLDAPYTVNSGAERAELKLLMFYHAQGMPQQFTTAMVQGLPGPLSQEYPSTYITSQGARVETVFVPAPIEPAPGVLLIHGDGSHARLQLHLARAIALRGYNVMLVSQPGFGMSEGPPDLMGERTLHANSDALDALRARPGVDVDRLAVWGITRGATCAVQLAESRQDIKAVVAQSGMYDVSSAMAGNAYLPMRQTIEREAGTDSLEWIARSPLRFTNHVHAAVLLLHGERDPEAPTVDAHRLEIALKAYGVHVETYFFPQHAHHLPNVETIPASLEFLDRILKR